MRVKALFLPLFVTLLTLLGAAPALAQQQSGNGYVTLTATIPTYAGGQVTADLVNNTGSSQLVRLSNSAFPQHAVNNLNSSGLFAITLADNGLIVPGGTQWQVTICAKAGNLIPCYPITLTVSCVNNASCSKGTLDVSSSFTGAPTPPNPLINNYVDRFSDETVGGAKTFTSSVSALTLNGVINGNLEPGSDLGAKANAAFAQCTNTAPCTVRIPRGTYFYPTTIVPPSNVLQGSKLELDAGAILNYTGTGYGVDTGTGCFNCVIEGGYIFGNASAKGGIRIGPGTSRVTVSRVAVQGFPNGDGILVAGANGVSIDQNAVDGNRMGVHLIGQPGFAPNAVHITNNRITFNTRWGIIVGDLTQFPGLGVSSPAFNNLIEGNTFDGNGLAAPGGGNSPDCSGPSSCGVIFDTLTVGTLVIGNYFETNPHAIVAGGLNYNDPLYGTLYGVSQVNSGSSDGLVVIGNFFNTANAPDIELNFSGGAHIDGNSDNKYGGTKTSGVCSVVFNTQLKSWAGHNNFQGATPFCVGTTPGLPTDANTLPGPVTVNGPINATSLNVPTTSGIVEILGPLTINLQPTDPAGLCGNPSLWFNTNPATGGLSICQDTGVGGFEWHKVAVQ